MPKPDCHQFDAIDYRCWVLVMVMVSELLSTGPETVVLNADAVYVTTYSVLHLTMRLHRSAYFTGSEKSLPLSEVMSLILF